MQKQAYQLLSLGNNNPHLHRWLVKVATIGVLKSIPWHSPFNHGKRNFRLVSSEVGIQMSICNFAFSAAKCPNEERHLIIKNTVKNSFRCGFPYLINPGKESEQKSIWVSLGNFFFNRSRYLISLSLFHSAQLCLSFSAGLISNIIFANVSFPSAAPFS